MPFNPTRPRRIAVAYLVLLVAVLLTGGMTAVVARGAAAKDRLRFENAVQHAQDSIQSRLETHISLLRGAAGLFAADPFVDRAAFHAYVARLHLPQHYAGVQGIGYSRRLRPEEKPALVQRMRREGDPAFHLWPEFPRPEEHAILYLEPLDRRNRRAIGYNMFSEAQRRAAMERARDAGQPAATGRVTLVQEIGPPKQAGFLIYVPIYRQGVHPASVAARRQSLEGFVYSPFRAGDLLQGIFGTERHPRVQFQLFDGPELTAAHQLYACTLSAEARRYRPRYTARTTLDVAGRRWTILFATRPDFELSAASDEAPLTLVGGLLISTLLFGITRFQVLARETAEQTEEALREREEQLRLITDAVPALISYIDASGRYRFNNEAYEQWFRRPRTELQGTRVRDMMDEASYERIRPHVEAALAGQAVSFEARFPYPDGQERYVSASYVPHRSREGEVLGFVVLISDITARRQAEIDNVRLYREAQEARTAAETASRLKDEFLATVSHELRTPLNAILGYSQILRRGRRPPEETARGLEAIERNVKAQAQLIDDLLDVSRIISGKLRLTVQPVHLGDVIQAAIEAVTPAAAAREIDLRYLPETRAVFVSGDPGRLQQVVWNLLANAIKFTPQRGRVEVRLAVESGETRSAVISVTDTGIGIPPEFLPHVFDRFRQVDSSTTRRHGGLGLGLAIVRHLVELHGGAVRVESAGEDQGARFIVTLPLPAGMSEERAPGEDAGPPARPPAEQPPLDGVRVLVVDDEPDARELLRQILQESGAAVTTAASVREALAALEEGVPDVLLSDIGMPDEDGYALVRQLRAREPERGGRLPAAALTAFARAEDRRRALDAGFQTHVPKPIEPDHLIAVVAQLVGADRNGHG